MIVTAIPGQDNFPFREGLLFHRPRVALDTNLNRFAQLEGDRSLGLEPLDDRSVKIPLANRSALLQQLD